MPPTGQSSEGTPPCYSRGRFFSPRHQASKAGTSVPASSIRTVRSGTTFTSQSQSVVSSQQKPMSKASPRCNSCSECQRYDHDPCNENPASRPSEHATYGTSIRPKRLGHRRPACCPKHRAGNLGSTGGNPSRPAALTLAGRRVLSVAPASGSIDPKTLSQEPRYCPTAP